MSGVVPGKERAEIGSILVRVGKAAWVGAGVFGRFELALRIRVVVGSPRPAVAGPDVEIDEQLRDAPAVTGSSRASRPTAVAAGRGQSGFTTGPSPGRPWQCRHDPALAPRRWATGTASAPSIPAKASYIWPAGWFRCPRFRDNTPLSESTASISQRCLIRVLRKVAAPLEGTSLKVRGQRGPPRNAVLTGTGGPSGITTVLVVSIDGPIKGYP